MKSYRGLVWTLFILIFILSTVGCGGGGSENPEMPPAANNEISSAAPTEELVDPAPEVIAEPPQSSQLQIDELDPCLMVTKEEAEAVLGQSVDDGIVAENEIQKSCTYIAVPAEIFITVNVYHGDGARSFLLSDIAGLQDGCSMIWLNTWAGESPLPAEVEALRQQPVLDLFINDLELQSGCGLSYLQLENLGENAFNFLPIFGTVIGVADDDSLVTFLYVDQSMSPEEGLEAASELVQTALME